MTCELCGLEDKKQMRQGRVVARTQTGDPIVCHQLECGHQWHIEYAGRRTRVFECTCSDYKRPATKPQRRR